MGGALVRDGRRERRARRPKVRNKRVWASVERDLKVVIEEAFDEALARDPQHRRQWVVLVDGNKDQLAAIKLTADSLDRAATVP